MPEHTRLLPLAHTEFQPLSCLLAARPCSSKPFRGITFSPTSPTASHVSGEIPVHRQLSHAAATLAAVQGTVDWFHLTEELPTREWAAAYSEKQRLNARILYVDAVLKRVGLTLSPALVKGGPLPPPLPTGTVVQQAKVCRIDPGMGMLMRASAAVDGKTLARTAYVHVRTSLATPPSCFR